jgi:hypothetical protein
VTRSGWFPVVIGIALGLAGGLYYAWIVNPVEYVDTAPNSLRADFKADYLALIASAYAGTNDLARARARLALFSELDPSTELAALAQQRLAAGFGEVEAAALARLAADLAGPTGGPAPTASPGASGSATPVPSPIPTWTPRPSPTPGAPFTLASQEQVCDSRLAEPLIQVEVTDAAGEGVPGVEIIVVWDAGEDHFFTGLKPELGPGYADFSMAEGVSYTLRLADSQQLLTDLSTHECEAQDGSLYLGSWLVRFHQSP